MPVLAYLPTQAMYSSFLVYCVLYVPGVLIPFVFIILNFQSKTVDRLLNFVGWNVKGLNHPVKRRRVLSHIKQFKPEIVFCKRHTFVVLMAPI